MEIRRATRSDLAFMTRMLLQVQEAHVGAFPHRYRPISSAVAETFLAEALESEKTLIVAEDDGSLLGYALFEIQHAPDSPFLRPRRFAYLQQIGVDKAVRGSGVGRALLQEVREICDREGVTEIELDVWSFNAGGRAFFERAGFVVFATKMRWDDPRSAAEAAVGLEHPRHTS